MLTQVRAALKAFDPFISIWWSEHKRCQSHPDKPGRWRVMEWMPRLGNWVEVFTWETAGRGYASPWPVDPIIARLGRARVRMDEAAQKADIATQIAKAKETAEFHDGLNQWARDQAERMVGSRATPRTILHATSMTQDGIRRRAAASAGMFRQGPQKLSNHERFLLDHFKRQEGSK